MIDSTNATLCDLDAQNVYRREFIMLGIIGTPVILIGALANIINIAIFSNSKMQKSSINVYFLVLAIADLSILLISVPTFVMPSIFNYYQVVFLHGLIKSMILYAYPIANITQTVSVWTTVVMATYRCIGVCKPFWAQRNFTRMAVITSIAVIVVASIGVNLSRFFELTTAPCTLVLEGVSYDSLMLEMLPLRQKNVYQITYYITLMTLLKFLLPFTILITVNTKTIMAVRKAQRETRHMVKINKSTGTTISVKRDTFDKLSSINSSGTQSQMIKLIQRKARPTDSSSTTTTRTTRTSPSHKVSFPNSSGQVIESPHPTRKNVAANPHEINRDMIQITETDCEEDTPVLVPDNETYDLPDLVHIAQSKRSKSPIGLLRVARLVQKPRTRPSTGPSNKDKTTTLMLVTLVFAFLFCNVGAFINNVIEVLLDSQVIPSSYLDVYHILTDYSNLMVLINSSINIIIYTWFSKQYRSLLQKLLGKRGNDTGPAGARINHVSVRLTTKRQPTNV